MKRNKIIYDRWLRVLFLSFALLVGGGGWMAWGQEDVYTDPTTDKKINLKPAKNGSRENIRSVETKTLYVKLNKNGEKNWRELFIPELRISQPQHSNNANQTTGDLTMNWYVHWYVEGKGTIKHKKVLISEDEADARGGAIPEKSYITQNRFWKVENENGLVWSNRLKVELTSETGCGMDVSTIGFSLDETDYVENETKIYCDVSIYQDGNISTDKQTYQEPSLFKRYIYEVIKAEESPTKEKDIVKQTIDFPKGSTSINFTMPHTPENYFWGGSDGTDIQGTTFMYSIGDKNGTYKDFRLVALDRPLSLQRTQKIDLSKYDKDVTIYVKVRDGDYKNRNIAKDNVSDVITEYTFHPVEHSQFMLEEESKNYGGTIRWPRNYPKKYRQIGIVDFDQNNTITHDAFVQQKNTNTKDNMSPNPVGSYLTTSKTTYGFLAKGSNALQKDNKGCYTTLVNAYGLFRSANVSGISGDSELCSNLDATTTKRYYKWISNYIAKATGHNYENKTLNTGGNYKTRELYDRTYEITKSSDNPRHGYFYYVDATDEPGTLIEVPITGTICGNTELKVTAWVSDMTRACLSGGRRALPPNINLILKGIDQETKKEVILHWFTSSDAKVDTTYNHGGNCGHINSNLMLWQQLCYEFIIPEEKIKKCDPASFHLEIQNNEPHTDGADYAIDDIRIFKTIPDIKVVQSGNPCDEKIKTVKFKSNYNMLLSNFGLTAETEISENENLLTYAEFEKLPEDHLLKKYLINKYKTEENIKDALKYFKAIYYAIYDVSGNVDGEGRPIPQNKPITIKYGNQESTYRTSYLSTRLEDMAWTTWSEESSSGGTFKADDGYITSANVSINGELTANKTYIARVSETPIEGGDLVCQTCSFYNSFVLEGVGDRIIVTKDDQSVDIKDVKPGASYHVTGTLKYNLPGSDELRPIDDPIFDWYLGTWDEFVKPGTITAGAESYSIMEAFKAAFHELNNTSVSNTIEQALKTKLGEYTKDNTDGKLILNTKSFDFSLPTGKNMQWGIMLPRAQQNNIPPNAVICPDPHEFLLGGTPPTIDPGDPDVPDPEDPDPDDPEDPDPKDPEDPDTPQPDENPFDGSHVRSVRVGLVQIQDMQQNSGTLRIPIHARTSLDNEKFAIDNTKKEIIVYKTSDKDWDLKLTSPKVVATLVELADDVKPMDWRKHYFKIEFTEQAKTFKEGFWYMVGIPYMVIDKNTNAKKEYGDRVFMLTLKIVPEYVTWVGSTEGMYNWNNDGRKHWRRSNDSELYTTNIASANGTHKEAYTPMRFTKVTVADNGATPYSAYPYLYELKKNTGNQTKDPKNVLLDMAPANMDATIGAATKNIEYDLLADPDYERELFGSVANPDKASSIHNYSCVRFYGNTCNEIYIKPESEILHTEYLTYNTAHVDYEMASNRWYMLASPLKGVVSGDMYLPIGTSTVGKYARQETPAFGEINYDNTNYTRWNPAVYMRGWDKATATVVRPDGSGSTRVNYGIKGSWSNLYNDVDVPFTPGTGFSIGTKTAGSTTNKVLFRLPKADMKYKYYGNTSSSEGNETSLTNRTDNGRFYISPDKQGKGAVTSCNVSATSGMFGNPFMSHLDMEKFLNGKSQNIYYIMTSTGTTTHILGDEYSLSTGDADPKYVAPLQSFIVKDLTSATFTTDMIAKAPATGKPGLRSTTSPPADEPLPQLRITATRDGVRNTAVVAGLVTASDSYVEGEDAALLINEDVAAPQVYTLAGNQMTAINVTPELNKIPVGIHSKDATPVELSFKVSGAMQNVTLVDKQAGKSYPVTDNLTLTVPGNTSGRYFLNGSIVTSNEIVAQNRIIFYSSTNGRIDISSTDPLTKITVYDISGRQIRVLNHINAPVAAIEYLRPGIYLVQAESITQTVTEKVDVK